MKTINIFGSCCSRFIFNYSPINQEFRVGKYAFQNNIWACFDSPLGLKVDDIEKIDTAPFTRRMVNYEFNKAMLPELEAFHSDYFLLDLQTMRLPLYEITYNGKTTYTQNINIGANVLPKMCEMSEFSSLTYSKIDFSSISEVQIKNGLDKFSEWLLSNYSTDRIIIYTPKSAYRYILASDLSHHDYPPKEISRLKGLDDRVIYYTQYFISKLGNVICYEYSGEFIGYDSNCQDHVPAAYHYADEVYQANGLEILNLLSK